MISRKNFENLGIGSRKPNLNHVPTIVPRTKRNKEVKPRTTSKARNRADNMQNVALAFEHLEDEKQDNSTLSALKKQFRSMKILLLVSTKNLYQKMNLVRKN